MVDFIGRAAVVTLAWPVGTNVVLCRPRSTSSGQALPGLDPLVTLTRHFRAGLLIVPSLRDLVGCFDKLV